MTDDLDRTLAAQEAIAALGGFWRLVADRCISNPDALAAARWKLPQLRIAKDCGFLVPHTLVTSIRSELASFVAQHQKVVTKAVQDARVGEIGKERYGFTQIVTAIESVGREPAPVLVQAQVEKQADVRITQVGATSFGVRIRTPSGASVDFRETPSADAQYEVYPTSETLQRQLRSFLGAFGLRFGAFDFAEDHYGALWFLECNPNGQWGWLESYTGLKITDAILDELLAVA